MKKCNKKVMIFWVTMTVIILSGCNAFNNVLNTSGSETTSGLIISEVVSSNSTSLKDPDLGHPDWIELCTTSESPVDLSGYSIFTKKDGRTAYNLPDITLSPNQYLVLYCCPAPDKPLSGKYCTGFKLSKSGFTLFLAHSNSIVQELQVPALDTDVSYGIDSSGSYKFFTAPTPGKQNNDSSLMTEEQIKSEIEASDITVSEVLPKGANGESWVELYNRGTTKADLSIFCITDKKTDPAKWHIPQSNLDPGKYAVIYMAGDEKNKDGMHASFNIGREDRGIYLYDINGGLKSSLTWDGDIPGGVSVISNNTYSLYPTMGAVNSTQTFNLLTQTAMDDTDPVRINEVLKNNKYGMTDSGKNHLGWVELYNKGSKPVSLKGYFLSDNASDMFRWAFPDTQIPAGGYITVFLNGEKDGQKDLHTSFGLSDEETALYLTNDNGMRVDKMNLPGAVGNDISVGRDSSGKMLYYSSPTPNEVNGQGQYTAPENAYNSNKKGLYISEVCAASKPRSGENDWIELHNSMNNDINLGGYYLSDDADNIKKWKIPSSSIQAGSYRVFEASSASIDPNIADFGISPSGETLFLSNPDGVVMDVFNTGVLSYGITSGRPENDTSKRVYYTNPTKGAANDSNYLTGYAETPLFSQTGLYQTKSFQLTITCATQGAKIYYTTDGSIPTNFSKLYTGAITISGNTPIRAVAYSDGLLPSDITSYTYIFDSPHTVPVVCINGKQIEMDYLLNTNSRIKPEYLASVAYYETDGTLGVSFASGVRPKGKSSLSLPQNSLSIALRSDYGRKEVDYKFFPGSKITTFSTLCLRSSGQDSTIAKIRDSYFQTISQGTNVTSISTRPVVLYVNGKYSGLYDLDEDQSGSYYQTHYGVKKSNLDFINVFANKAQDGDMNEWNHILSITRTWNLADDEVFAQYQKYVDTDAIIDYLVAKIYFGNGDGTNQRYFRARDYSVRWTPVLFDLDYDLRFGRIDQNVFDRYFSQTASIGAGQSGVEIKTKIAITWALKKNKAWCQKFEERFVQLAETQYSPDRMVPIYDSMINVLRPEMPANIARYHTPKDMAYWESEVSLLRNAISQRRDVVLKQLQNYFNIPSSQMQQWEQKYSSKN